MKNLISSKPIKQLKDLIAKYNFKDVRKRLAEIYPGQKRSLPGYKDVFERLKRKRGRQSKLSISLKTVKERGEEPWVSITGIGKGKPFGFAIEFTPWTEWVGMRIEKKTLKLFSEIDILCHCLWEMTWSGFTEEKVQKEIRELERRVKDIKSGKAKCVPWSEFKKKLGKNNKK